MASPGFPVGIDDSHSYIGADPNNDAVCSAALVEPSLSDVVRFVCAEGSTHPVYRDAADLVVATVLDALAQI